MSVLSTLRSLTLLAAVSLTLVGCKQADGEVCDVDSDCEMGSTCCGGGRDGLPAARGICQATCDDVERDAGPPRDSGPEPDAGTEPDGGAEPDAGTDAGTAADAGTDGGEAPSDAGTDAGSVEDAGSDAGDAS